MNLSLNTPHDASSSHFLEELVPPSRRNIQFPKVLTGAETAPLCQSLFPGLGQGRQELHFPPLLPSLTEKQQSVNYPWTWQRQVSLVLSNYPWSQTHYCLLPAFSPFILFWERKKERKIKTIDVSLPGYVDLNSILRETFSISLKLLWLLVLCGFLPCLPFKVLKCSVMSDSLWPHGL